MALVNPYYQTPWTNYKPDIQKLLKPLILERPTPLQEVLYWLAQEAFMPKTPPKNPDHLNYYLSERVYQLYTLVLNCVGVKEKRLFEGSKVFRHTNPQLFTGVVKIKDFMLRLEALTKEGKAARGGLLATQIVAWRNLKLHVKLTIDTEATGKRVKCLFYDGTLGFESCYKFIPQANYAALLPEQPYDIDLNDFQIFELEQALKQGKPFCSKVADPGVLAAQEWSRNRIPTTILNPTAPQQNTNGLEWNTAFNVSHGRYEYGSHPTAPHPTTSVPAVYV